MIITISLFNIYHYSYLQIFFLWWELLRYTFLAAFKYTTIITIRLYIISPGLIYFIIRSFYFLTISTDFTQHLPSHLWQPPICSLYLWVQFCFFIFFQIPHMNDIIWHLSFSVWLISLSIMISRSICVVTNAGSPPFNGWIIVQCLFIHIYSTFFLIHSSIDGHLGHFHVLAIGNNGVMNMRVQIFFEVSIFASFRKISGSGTAGSYGSSTFNFLRKLHPVFHSGCTNSHFYQQCTKNLFPPHPCQCLLLLAFFIIAILTDVRGYLIVV